MTENLEQTTKEEISQLPKEAQDAINVSSWVSITEKIGKEYNLIDDEIEDLQLEILFVLTGYTYLKHLPRKIEDYVVTTKKEAEEIANKCFEQIFKPINDAMIENVKNNPEHNNADAEKNLNFILSGGNYSAFITPSSPPLSGEDQGGVLNSPHPNPLLKVEGGNVIPVKPPSLADIKSKFTI